MVDNKKILYGDYYPFTQSLKQELSVDYSDIKKTVEPSAVVIGGASEIDVPDLDLRAIEQLLYKHPVIPRGIEIKANRIVSPGYKISGPDDEYTEYCSKILKNAGGIVFLKRWTEDAYAFGNGYAELIPNRADNEIVTLAIAHPVYFGLAKTKQIPENRPDIDQGADKLYVEFDAETGRPVGYKQYRYINNQIEPYGELISMDSVAHLMFDRWGDEVEGISLIKYIINILNYTLNIENAAAEAGYRAANPRYKFNTSIEDINSLNQFASMVAGINERDSIILTSGNDVDILSPGNTNFGEYHDRFMNLLSIRLGIPKPLLLMDGTSTNKATIREQTDFIRQDSAADEEAIVQGVMNQIFVPACQKKFGASYDETKVPEFKFKEFIDSEDALVERLKEKSLGILNLTNAGLQLLKNGLVEEARNIFNMIPKQTIFNAEVAAGEIENPVTEAIDTTKLKPATNQNPEAQIDEDGTIENN